MKANICKSIAYMGWAAIIFQIFGVIVNLAQGNQLPTINFGSPLLLSYSISTCIGYYSFFIAGLIVLIVGGLVLPKILGVDTCIFPYLTNGDSKKAAKNWKKKAAEEGIRLCPDCGGSVKANELFCSKCKRKM